ncbi:synaptojanin-2-binding protein-like [Elysia marginata]|uniref:Synaptojanin-2-binding protein-like n=1 Tax=Elysia marginata TaxID=1093978 RepID=A0AAV4J2A0_9GAST|nr:synaptojanin-2-binding protein-like [Elysia marginata]
MNSLKRNDNIQSLPKKDQVNGHRIQSVTHNEAVQIFITAGETVHLKVQHGAEDYILKQLEAKKGGGGGKIILLLVILAAAAGVGFFVMNQQK